MFSILSILNTSAGSFPGFAIVLIIVPPSDHLKCHHINRAQSASTTSSQRALGLLPESPCNIRLDPERLLPSVCFLGIHPWDMFSPRGSTGSKRRRIFMTCHILQNCSLRSFFFPFSVYGATDQVRCASFPQSPANKPWCCFSHFCCSMAAPLRGLRADSHDSPRLMKAGARGLHRDHKDLRET